jgi:hypothetical protein
LANLEFQRSSQDLFIISQIRLFWKALISVFHDAPIPFIAHFREFQGHFFREFSFCFFIFEFNVTNGIGFKNIGGNFLNLEIEKKMESVVVLDVGVVIKVAFAPHEMGVVVQFLGNLEHLHSLGISQLGLQRLEQTVAFHAFAS